VTRAQGAVEIDWLTSAERRSGAEIWEDLEGRFGGGALACSWDWTSSWLEHYGDVVPHRFAVGAVNGVPCGITLVTTGVGRRRGPFRVRSVHIGTAGEPPRESVFVEYNRILVEPDRRADFCAALVRALRDESGWDELALDGFDPEEAAPLLAVEPRFQPAPATCRVLDLTRAQAKDGDVLATLGGGTRKQVRRSHNALEQLESEWASTPEHASDILDELIDLHQRRWTDVGETGAFASPRFVGFHRTVIRRLMPKGAVILFRVRAGGATVGCLYNFVERGRVLSYQTGLASHADRKISPGFVTFAACMQACYERGLREYDFLAGDSLYKQQLSTTTRELVWAKAPRPSLRWRALDRLAAARRTVRGLRPGRSG